MGPWLGRGGKRKIILLSAGGAAVLVLIALLAHGGRSAQARPAQARPGQARPGQARPGQARPPGLQWDGSLDVGCRLRGTRGYTSFAGAVTLYNPGDSAQSVSTIGVNWDSNGILLGQQAYQGTWIVGPHQILAKYAPAPMAATSCEIAGWNP